MSAWRIDFAAQFRGLDPRDPGRWPLAPRLAAWACALGGAVALGWVFLLADAMAGLESARARESALRDSYRAKLGQAMQIDELRRHRQIVQEGVDRVEEQLPDGAEMDALLSGINQAGLARQLNFDLFKPGPVQMREFHAELPIAIKVSGRYHDLGGFAADLARLPRIVSIQDIHLTLQAAPTDTRLPQAPVRLSMEATARTYRILSPEEIAEQQRLKAEERNRGARR
jgi:type IV pilus assembly protein PilO